MRIYPQLKFLAILSLFAISTVAEAQSEMPQMFVDRLAQTCPTCDAASLAYADAAVSNMNFSNLDQSGADFSNAVITSTSFEGTDLSNADFSGATIGSAGQALVNFAGADLSGANFDGATFLTADIQYATLSCTNFDNSDMSGVLAGAALIGLDKSCPSTFDNATINCNLEEFSGQIDLSTATVPGTCSAEPDAIAEEAATEPDAAWTCAGTVPTGFDGYTYANPVTGSDTDACTASAPCASIGTAMAACSGSGSCGVLLDYAQYELSDTLELAANQTIFGACLADTSGATADQSDYYSLIQMSDDAPGAPVFAATDVADVGLSFLHLVGSSATASSGISVTLKASGSATSLTLTSLSIVGGNGAPGARGTDAAATENSVSNASGQTGGANGACSADGGNGGNGKGGSADLSWDGLKYKSECSPTCSGDCSGAPGAVGSHGSSNSYSNGGVYGTTVCSSNITYNCDNGKGADGYNGYVGNCGAGGAQSADDTGVFSNAGWTPSVGGNGQAGGTGGAGGGGGGGGLCVAIPLPFDPVAHDGQHGGGGGPGGCGGNGGLGGTQGGGTFGILAEDATLVLVDTTITGGTGGTGGDGGTGTAGGQGGTGESGATKSGGYSDGGRGGSGAPGGSGGGGAPGNGGPSINLVTINAASYTGVLAGITGNGGTAGDRGGYVATSNNTTSQAACTPNKGDYGKAGRVTPTQHFTY